VLIPQSYDADVSLQNKWILLGYIDDTDHCVPSSISGMYITFIDSVSYMGFSACNQMEGTYNIYNNNVLEISSPISTQVYCLDDLRNTWEDIFTKTLMEASSFTIEGKYLIIEATNGKRLVFVSN
jgi:heat shock protein HslJ